MTQKPIALAMSALMLAGVLAGCGQGSGAQATPAPTPAAAATTEYQWDFGTKNNSIDDLKQPCDQQGTVVELEYDTPAYAVNDLLGLDETLHKKVCVYLPYGYDESKQYNILYLLHGTEGDTDGPMEEFWLKQWGDQTLPVLDNMIAQGLCDPVIVVTPTYYSRVEDHPLGEAEAKALAEKLGDSYIGSEGEGDELEQNIWPEYFGQELRNICCALCLSLLLGLFDSSRKEHELEITRTLMEQKQEQYKTSRSMILAINKKCHQLKIRLGEMSAQGGQQRQISEAMDLVNSFDAAVHTGNEVLDIIFTEKNSYCLQSQITFVCMIDGEKLNFMAPADLYVLFGNMIDSGIQTVLRLSDPARRTIYVNVHQEKHLLLIQVEYPFGQTLRPEASASEDFGARGIQMVLDKYGGSSNIKLEDHTFYQNIVLPMQ